MNIKRAVATAAAAATAVVSGLLGVPAASAADEGPPPLPGLVNIKQVVRQAGNSKTALVTVEYQCPQIVGPTHLWVSVKQGGPDPTADGSAKTVTSWYDDHPRGIVCDDTWHSRTFPVTLAHDVPWMPGKTWSPLQRGKDAWVQFCITQGDEESGYFDMGVAWVPVK